MHSNGCIILLQAESQISASSSLIVLHVAKKKKKVKRGKAKAIVDFREQLERKGSWWGKYIGLVDRDDTNHTAEAINTSKIETRKKWVDAKWKEWVYWVLLGWSLFS